MNSEMCHVLWVVRRIVILDGLVENFFPWRSALIKLKECSLSMWKLLSRSSLHLQKQNFQ